MKIKKWLTIFIIIIIATGSIAFYFLTKGKETNWPQKNSKEKVVVLGFDGVEHTLLEKYMNEGQLPNLKKLKEHGTYSTLETTVPAQSPVSWSSFSTGTNPGKHNIFDFIIRDPKTYLPRLGMSTSKEEKILGLIPKKPEIINNQKGKTFWETLSNGGIKSKIIRVPITFPAKPLNGKLLTGLGTPDAMGTIGTFHYFTTEKTNYKDNDQSYKLITLENKDTLNTKITGPKDKTTNLKIVRKDNEAEITVSGKKFTLKKGGWSDFKEINFNLLGPLYKMRGYGRFYLIESKPELKLYLSPINFSPTSPFFDISYPKSFSKSLAKENGIYKTLGWDIDTWALKEERISENVFLEDLNSTMDEQIKILKNELSKDDWNVFVQVFQSTDVVSHMFFRYLDPGHPRYEDNPKYRDAILEVYKKMDNVVGEVEKNLDKDTTLIVMSDHGFSSYRKSVDLNAWLVENGYMTLKDPDKRSDYLQNIYKGGVFWENVDWSRTKAYAMGLGSIYINLKNREGSGVISNEEYPAVRNEILEKLKGLKDGDINIVSEVYKREDIMHGPYLTDAGDLIIGFNKGYRISWQTTFGSIPANVIFPNNNKWSGDHCSVDSKLIPGIFLSNKKIDANNINIEDLAPTILKKFEIEIPLEIDGQVKSIQ